MQLGRYFNQSPDVWLKFLMPGDNTKNSVKSIYSLARAKLQSSRRSMIHAHMLIEIKHYTKVDLDVDKLRAYMESAMGHHIHVNNKIPGSGREDLNRIKYTERRDIIKDVCTNKDMIVIRKNWQALPVTATTVTAPVSAYTPDPIQQPLTPSSSQLQT